MNEWQLIETYPVPTDGTWFMVCNAADGFESYEVGRYEQLFFDTYVEAGNGIYRKERISGYDWRGFNNMHRATHWARLPEPPK